MADVAGITAIRPTQFTQVRNVAYGATIAAGKTVTMVSNVAQLSDADASVALAATEGIAITPGINAGYGLIAFSGPIILVGATLVVGTIYITSGDPGGISPITDAGSGDWVTILGTAATTTQLNLTINRTAVQVP